MGYYVTKEETENTSFKIQPMDVIQTKQKEEFDHMKDIFFGDSNNNKE